MHKIEVSKDLKIMKALTYFGAATYRSDNHLFKTKIMNKSYFIVTLQMLKQLISVCFLFFSDKIQTINLYLVKCEP